MEADLTLEELSSTTRVEPIEVLTGDHCLVLLTIDETKIEAEKSIRRDWRNYTKDKLINEICRATNMWTKPSHGGFGNFFPLVPMQS